MLGLQIRTKSKEGTTPLYTRIRMENTSVWVNLELYVDVKKWSEVSNSERKQSNFLDMMGYTKKISEIEFGIKDLRARHKLTKVNLDTLIKNVVLADIRDKLIQDEELGKLVEERKKKDVKTFIKKYVDGIIKGEILNTKGEKYSRNSISSWKQFRRLFFKCYKNQSFTWDELDQALIHQFLNFLSKNRYMGETINRHVGVYSTLITVAEKQKLHTNGIARKWLKTRTVSDDERKTNIYLTKEELKILYDLPLTGIQEKARDLFLVACYTAVRYCDIKKIKRDSIGITEKGTQVIRITQQKTRKPVVIPIINDELVKILQKYDYNIPSLSDQKLNENIKLVCEKASKTTPSLNKKIKTLLTKTERDLMSKGKMKFEFDEEGYAIKPRWELVCCHTARRTAITNMRLSGKLTTPQIMSVSGHKKEETFLKYIRLSLDEKADDVADAASDGLF